MESGLEGRNNLASQGHPSAAYRSVSMESGLEGRNNLYSPGSHSSPPTCLNGVRPRRPEQSHALNRSAEPLSVPSQWSPA